MSEGMHTEGVGAFEAGGGVRVGSTGGLQVSSFCMHGDCVAVEFTAAGFVTVAHSGAPDERVEVTRAEWVAFIKGVKNGEFDLEPPTNPVERTSAADDQRAAETARDRLIDVMAAAVHERADDSNRLTRARRVWFGQIADAVLAEIEAARGETR